MRPLDLGDRRLEVPHRHLRQTDVAMWCLRHEMGEPAVVDLHADAHELRVVACCSGLPESTEMNGTGSMFMLPWKITPAAMPS